MYRRHVGWHLSKKKKHVFLGYYPPELTGPDPGAPTIYPIIVPYYSNTSNNNSLRDPRQFQVLLRNFWAGRHFYRRSGERLLIGYVCRVYLALWLHRLTPSHQATVRFLRTQTCPSCRAWKTVLLTTETESQKKAIRSHLLSRTVEIM